MKNAATQMNDLNRLRREAERVIEEGSMQGRILGFEDRPTDRPKAPKAEKPEALELCSDCNGIGCAPGTTALCTTCRGRGRLPAWTDAEIEAFRREIAAAERRSR